MRTLFKIFNSSTGARPFWVVSAFLLSSFSGGIGLISLLPVLAIVVDGGEEKSGPARVVVEWLQAIGIQPELKMLLGFVVAMMLVKVLLNFIAMRFISNTAAEVSTSLRRRVIGGIHGRQLALHRRTLEGQFHPFGQLRIRRAPPAPTCSRRRSFPSGRKPAIYLLDLVHSLLEAGAFRARPRRLHRRGSLVLDPPLTQGGAAANRHPSGR